MSVPQWKVDDICYHAVQSIWDNSRVICVGYRVTKVDYRDVVARQVEQHDGTPCPGIGEPVVLEPHKLGASRADALRILIKVAEEAKEEERKRSDRAIRLLDLAIKDAERQIGGV